MKRWTRADGEHRQNVVGHVPWTMVYVYAYVNYKVKDEGIVSVYLIENHHGCEGNNTRVMYEDVPER